MKLVNNLFIAVCIATTISAEAQKENNSRKKVTTKKVTRNRDTTSNSEAAINKYKSKHWRQGINVIEGSPDKRKSKPGTGTKPRKSRTVPSAPVPGQPPTGLPPASK
ncbi:MAG: hypothetical protein ACR2KZ_06680 [Segetibacter sp.]